jgi:membrane protease YdiL (CAAX protease family)
VRILLFVGLTFLVSWGAWFGAGAIDPAAPAVAAQVAADRHSFAWWALVNVGTFAPSLVAIALTLQESGSAGLSQLVSRLVKGQVKLRWYAFALGYMLAIKLVVALVFRVTQGTWPAFTDEPFYLLVVATVFSTILFTQAGEELGWRGYMLPRLASRFGYAWSGVMVGVVWAAWHLPLFIIAGTDKTGQSFPIWGLSVAAISVAITWLYANTGGSLLLTMLMHAAINNIGSLVPSATPGATDVWALSGSPQMVLTLVVLWVPAVWFLRTMPRYGG